MLRISIVEDQDDIRNSLVKNIQRTEGLKCVISHASAEDALEK